MTPTKLTEAVSAVDQQVAAWLEGLADELSRARNLYWRGEMSNVVWQMHLDESLNEMREVARILRTRPIHREARR